MRICTYLEEDASGFYPAPPFPLPHIQTVAVMDKRRGLTISIEDSARTSGTAVSSDQSLQKQALRPVVKKGSPRHIRLGACLGDSLKGEKRSISTKNGRMNSTETLCEDTTISDAFNSHTLLRSFAPSFNIQEVMQRLFPQPRRSSSRPTPSVPSPKSRCRPLFPARKTDSVFSEGEW